MEEQEQVQNGKFNIGDKVVLKSADEIKRNLGIGSLGCSYNMISMAGGEFEIHKEKLQKK